jgi:RNA polymerase sigma factor (sigma-70 family)
VVNDARLVDAIAANSADLLAYFERRVDVPADAADLVAETMMTAWRRADDLPPVPERARMWLFGIARNTLLNSERSERRRWRLANRLRMLIGPSSTSAADEGAEVRDAVARLEPELAELVRLVHWDGFTLIEAAGLLGIPPSTARGRYGRAKDELRRTLTTAAVPACG